jgi:hypothetical protein
MRFAQGINKILRESFSIMNELHNLGNFNKVQKFVLMNLVREFGAGDPAGWFASEQGQQAMRLYRQVVGDLFGWDEPNMPNSDLEADPRFESDPTSLAKQISDEIVRRMNGDS